MVVSFASTSIPLRHPHREEGDLVARLPKTGTPTFHLPRSSDSHSLDGDPLSDLHAVHSLVREKGSKSVRPLHGCCLVPLYEETAYRSFLLVHFADFRTSGFSKRNLPLNSLQAALFLSIHKHHVMSGRPLVLVTVLTLAFLNGLIFLKTRNISGYILSHCAINGFALFLRWAYI